MIYEYPEEFVVSVAYVDDLSDKLMYRDWELEYMQIDGVLIEPYQKNMLSYDVFEEGLKDNHVKKIFKDIDNDYAESEVSMRNAYEI